MDFPDEDEMEQREDILTDDTEIGNTTWRNLKTSAMKTDYKQQNWFVSKILPYS